MLGIVLGVERFEQYVYGCPVHVETDHKPLESIFKKSLISAPKRLQRMLLRLQKFDLFVTYKKGSVLADTFSRAYRKRTCASTADTEDVVVIDVDLRGETEGSRAYQHDTVSTGHRGNTGCHPKSCRIR
jgi:hypothetical protein